MNERIKALCRLTLDGKMYVRPTPVAAVECPENMGRIEREADELCRYIMNQEPLLSEHMAFCGRFNFDGSVVGDAFKRGGHKYTQQALNKYYLKPQENLSTMEWQHATADYRQVLDIGLFGIMEKLKLSYFALEDERRDFSLALHKVAGTIIRWCEGVSRKIREFAKAAGEENRKRLTRLANNLASVPKHGAKDFYQAVLTIYVCFSADPDSVGTLDRYLQPYYDKGIADGTLTREEAKEYLQELFLMLQASTPKESVHFTRGGESHFCVGGYLPNGQDGFTDLSLLIIESMVELPTYIPQVTLRWTEKTPTEVLYKVMDLERQDPHKRIAFTNDEKRIKCYTEICGFPYERAVNYTMVGCNEPAFLGAITGSNSKGNILRCVETLFHKRDEKILAASDFDSFYSLFEEELFSDLQKIFDYDDMYNSERAKDYSYISSLFFEECVYSAKSLTQGGGKTVTASPMLIGVTNLIDSLIVVKQLVYDKKKITMAELIQALKNNWAGYEDTRTLILKTAEFFGNDTDTSSTVSKRVYDSLYRFYYGKKNLFGYPWLVGDLLGYNEHHKWFGEGTLATPDGRYSGQSLKFAIGQSEGKDREGLSALLNDVAGLDKAGIACGSTVTNLYLDKSLIENEGSFRSLVLMLEEYFRQGGVHFQLTYTSKEDLIKAKKDPQSYSGLRVRVTGFSDYFVKLKPSIQDDIIERTVKK
ncbi:MAG: hypothetical protein IKB27_01275 [Clostridia bacterium]|nr:hypothetical protein [Clostridia bacterium]